MHSRNNHDDTNHRLREKRWLTALFSKALGEYELSELLEMLSANHRLVHEIQKLLGSPNSELERLLPDTHHGYRFTRKNLAEVAQNLSQCSASFANGKPVYTCNQRDICCFCAENRARCVYNFYIRQMYARLSKINRVDVMYGAIKPCGPCSVVDLPESIANLKQCIRELRQRRLRKLPYWLQKYDRDIALRMATNQFDTFFHISHYRNTASGDTLVFPHMHILVSRYAYRYGMQEICKHLEKYARKFGFQFVKHGVLRVRREGSEEFPHRPWDYAKLAKYCSAMFKIKMPAEAKLQAMLSLPKYFRQHDRMKGDGRCRLILPALARTSAQVIYLPPDMTQEKPGLGKLVAAQNFAR